MLLISIGQWWCGMDNPVLIELLAIIRDPNSSPATVGWAKGRFNDLVDILKELT